MRSEPYHDELHTFRRATERRRHCVNEGWICVVADCHCRHDMIVKIIDYYYKEILVIIINIYIIIKYYIISTNSKNDVLFSQTDNLPGQLAED